ncbi:MAG: DUF4149 domain-containing protein [Acidobacteria bacterium]|nr:DUF4149 domain-containing protein [Acidobacteriota bacterium]
MFEVAILSAWLAMTLSMWFAATGTFGAVRRVLEGSNPQLAETTKTLTADQTRLVMRHAASEINRAYFRAYGWAQLVLGLGLLVLLLRQTPRDSVALIVAGMMLAVVAVLTLYVTPEIIALGRGIDFVPRDPAPREMPRFRMLHGAFTVLDGLKLFAGLGLLARWIWKS